MFGLQYFTFQEIWSPMFLFGTIAVIIGYLYIVGPWREKHFPQEQPLSLARKLVFIGAALLYYICYEGPLGLLGHILFSFHMTNMAISYLIVPPMILVSVPGFVWRKMLSLKFLLKLKFLMHPIVSLIMFNMLFSIYHIPVVHDYVMTNFTIHRIYYLVMLIAAFMMWWHVYTPVKEMKQMPHVKRMAYIFVNGVLLTPACALIIFSDVPLYAIYNDPDVWIRAIGFCVPGDTSRLIELTQNQGPQFFNMFTTLEDQQAGGIIMKLLQEVTFGVLLAFVFKEWFKREHKQQDKQDEQLLKQAMNINHK